MKKLFLNLSLSVSLFIVVSIILKATNMVIQIFESWFLLRVQGPTELTATIELVGYVVILPILAYFIARIFYKKYFKKSDVSFSWTYFIIGLILISAVSITLIATSSKSIVSIPFYDSNLPSFLMKFQNLFSKFDYRILAMIGVLFHNLVIALFGTLGINAKSNK